MKEILAHKGAQTVVRTLLNVREGEKVCVVTDVNMMDVARIVAAEVVSAGGDLTLTVMEPRKTNGEEPPAPVAAAMKAADVIITPTSTILSHTKARYEAQKAGARHCLMSDFTVDMLISGGLRADFVAIRPRIERLAQALGKAKTVRVTTKAGTDLTLQVEGRRPNAYHGLAHEPGTYSPCQCIEANISPIEDTAQGTLVIDGAVAGLIVVEEPIVMDIRDGFIVDIRGGAEARRLREHLEAKDDPNVYNIAELGIPMNPYCQIIGRALEDEGVFGTAHIGIGSNITLGGNRHASGHEDLVFWHPRIELDGEVILDGRELHPSILGGTV